MSQRLIAIVTGAGSGVGRETALLLAAHGCDVALVGRTAEKLQATADAVAQSDPEATTWVLAHDLADPASAGTIIEQVVQAAGRVDVLANVAGHAIAQPIVRSTIEQIRAILDINVTSVMQLTAGVWPIMKKQKSGVIVNVSSMGAYDPFPGFGLYAPAKAAVNMFTLCAGREGTRDGIRVVGVAPGAIETPMLRAMFNEKMLPSHKTLSACDVAQVICDCALGERDFDNGETLKMPSP